MALSDRLINNLIAILPGASEPVVRSEIWNVIDNFCRDTWAWRETIEVPLVIGQVTYTPAPAGTEIVQVFSVAHENLDVTGTIYEFGTLTLKNQPAAANVAVDKPLFVVAALTPEMTTGADIENLIPSDMWSTHYQTLLEGCRAALMGQPAKPYSNPQLALFHARKYTSEKTQAKMRARLGPTPGVQQWRFPKWA